MKKLSLAAWLLLAPTMPVAVTAAQDEGAEQAVSPKERFDALSQEADTVMREWSTEIRAKMKAAEEAGEELSDEEMTSPLGEFVPQFQAAAEEYAGTDDAVPFLVWIVVPGFQADPAASQVALDTIADAHHSSDQLGELIGILPYMGQIVENPMPALKKLATNSTVADVKESAGFALYVAMLEKSEAGSKEHEEALAGLTAIANSSENESLKSQAESKVNIAKTFGTGMVAPDISGIDLDGVAFNLSDYKGKIVFLDFWGDW